MEEDITLLIFETIKSVCLITLLLYFSFALNTWMHLVNQPVPFPYVFNQSPRCGCSQSITVMYQNLDSPPSTTIYRYYATNEQKPKMTFPLIHEAKNSTIKKENNSVRQYQREINTDVSSYPLLPFHNQIPDENEDVQISYLSNPDRTNRDLYCLYNRKWVTKRQFEPLPCKPISATLQPKPRGERMRTSMYDVNKSRHNVSYLY